MKRNLAVRSNVLRRKRGDEVHCFSSNSCEGRASVPPLNSFT